MQVGDPEVHRKRHSPECRTRVKEEMQKDEEQKLKTDRATAQTKEFQQKKSGGGGAPAGPSGFGLSTTEREDGVRADPHLAKRNAEAEDERKGNISKVSTEDVEWVNPPPGAEGEGTNPSLATEHPGGSSRPVEQDATPD